jgi:hypothetical protein
MTIRARRLGRVLAIAIAAALLISALPGSVASAASPRACKVYNLDKEIGRNTLQRAVWAADPGDRLAVRGRCTGATRIGKDLHIRGMRIKSVTPGGRLLDSGRPTIGGLVVDPRVDDLTIAKNVLVRKGVSVGSLAATKPAVGRPGSGPAAIPAAVPAGTKFTLTYDRTCRVSADGGWYNDLQEAIDANPGDEFLIFYGTCSGPVSITRDLDILGDIWIASSYHCRAAGQCFIHRTESGLPTIRSTTPGPALIIDASVTELALGGIAGGVTIKGGIAIRD